MNIAFHRADLTPSEQSLVSRGFQEHGDELGVPEYTRERLKWLATDDQKAVRAVLTADVLWDWLYIDELWVSPAQRGEGLGRKLMQAAEAHAEAQSLQGIWLWTQSWQAEGFYEKLGFDEFTRFDDFPKGHARIGFRKRLA